MIEEPFPNQPFESTPIASVTKGIRKQVTPLEFGDETVFHYSIPSVQATGNGVREPGRSIESNKWLIPEECVLISRLNPRKATVCRAAPQGEMTLASTEFVPLTAGNSTDNRFIEFVLGTLEVTDFLSSMATSVTRSHQRVNPRDVTRMPVPWPSFEVRRAIADYLDHETAEIDAFIADLDHFQELTTEHLKSLLNVLTLQPSSQDHHKTEGETVQLTRALPHRVDYRGATPIKRSSGIQLVTAGNVRSGWIDYTSPQEFVHTEDYADVMRRGKPEISDILFTMEAPLGNTALVDRTDIALAQRIVKFRASQIIRPTFAMLAMNSLEFQSQLRSLATGSTALGLKASKLSQLYLRVPGLSEQDAAVRQWSSASGVAQEMMSNTGSARELAVERRAALISAAVTGQIDVTKRHKPVAEVLEDEVRERV